MNIYPGMSTLIEAHGQLFLGIMWNTPQSGSQNIVLLFTRLGIKKTT